MPNGKQFRRNRPMRLDQLFHSTSSTTANDRPTRDCSKNVCDDNNFAEGLSEYCRMKRNAGFNAIVKLKNLDPSQKKENLVFINLDDVIRNNYSDHFANYKFRVSFPSKSLDQLTWNNEELEDCCNNVCPLKILDDPEDTQILTTLTILSKIH